MDKYAKNKKWQTATTNFLVIKKPCLFVASSKAYYTENVHIVLSCPNIKIFTF